MSNEEKENKLKEAMSNQDLFVLKSVQNINHKPHPYCITPKHLSTDSIYLDGDTIRETERKHGAHCGMYTSPDGRISNGYKAGWSPCHVPFDEHTSDTVACISLTRNCDNSEARVVLKSIVDVIGETFIDGFVFVETPEKFRVSEPTNVEES